MTIIPWLDQLEDPVVSDDRFFPSYWRVVWTRPPFRPPWQHHQCQGTCRPSKTQGAHRCEHPMDEKVAYATIRCREANHHLHLPTIEGLFLVPYEETLSGLGSLTLSFDWTRLYLQTVSFFPKKDAKVNSVPKFSMTLRPMSSTFMPWRPKRSSYVFTRTSSGIKVHHQSYDNIMDWNNNPIRLWTS